MLTPEWEKAAGQLKKIAYLGAVDVEKAGSSELAGLVSQR